MPRTAYSAVSAVAHVSAMWRASRKCLTRNALADWDLNRLDFLFIGNVGNLVSPASCDLGESVRPVLMSFTEGEDKPRKYPTISNSADIAVMTKTDLADAVEFDWEAAQESIQSVRPGMRVFRLSAKNGDGMNDYLNFISEQHAEPTAVPQT